MNDILSFGMEVIVWIQQFRSPVLDNFFQTITLLGNEEFYLLSLPIVFWCVSARAGIQLTYYVLTTLYINFIIKDLVAQPRPFELCPEVKLIEASGYSFPSNHAQAGLVFWFTLARLIKERWLWIVGVMLVVLIGISRVYLGVHFPSDVLAGWLLGGLVLVVLVTTEPMVANGIQQFNFIAQLCLAFILPLTLLGLHVSKEIVSIAAILSGAGIGLVVQRMYISDAERVPKGEWLKLLARLVVGTIGMLAIWAGLKSLFPEEGTDYYLFCRYVRYWLTGVWIALGAPGIFLLLNLGPGGQGYVLNSYKSKKAIRK